MLPFELAATPSQAPSANTATRDRAAADVVGLSRFELLTPRLSSVCSNQLSYRPGMLFKERSLQAAAYRGAGVPVPSKLDRRAIHTTAYQEPDRSWSWLPARPSYAKPRPDVEVFR